MLLALDIGNTNLHAGLWDGHAWRCAWRARTVADKTPDEYAVLLRSFFHSRDLRFSAVTGMALCCVVPRLTPVFVDLAQRYLRAEPLVISSGIPLGIEIAIDQPQQAGADRIANAAAVVALYGGGPAVVVDFGTATNFDVISAGNAYIGGALAPGIGLAHDALVSRAARLHKVDLEPPPSAVGSNTIHALQSGIFWGYVGLIEGLIARIKAALGAPAAQVISTGGLAPLFAQHTSAIDRHAPELTLDGMRAIYELNRGRTGEQRA